MKKSEVLFLFVNLSIFINFIKFQFFFFKFQNSKINNFAFVLYCLYDQKSYIKQLICSICCYYVPVFFSFVIYHRVCNKSNTTGATCGAGTAYTSGAPEFIPDFQWGSRARSLVFCLMFCRPLFVPFLLVIVGGGGVVCPSSIYAF